jgi:hypothetical protein
VVRGKWFDVYNINPRAKDTPSTVNMENHHMTFTEKMSFKTNFI